MSGDVHVRFCESLGLQRPGPLTRAKRASRGRGDEISLRLRLLLTFAVVALLDPQAPTASPASALRAELGQIRKDGMALGDEELGPGVRTIAAPVLDPDGRAVAAVGIPVPAAVFLLQELRRTLGPSVVAAAKGISAALRAAA